MTEINKLSKEIIKQLEESIHLWKEIISLCGGKHLRIGGNEQAFGGNHQVGDFKALFTKKMSFFNPEYSGLKINRYAIDKKE